MKKRVFACILALCLCVGLFVGLIAGCSHSENAPDPSKPQIVVTVFPIYDWMQNLLSDRAGEFGLTLLESSGADLHNYQPTVNDIYALSNCDLFVYIGGESDKWVADALTQAANKDMIVVNLMDALGALAREEELPEGLTEDEDEHDGPEYDEHIWLSVRNAAALCRVLTDALAKLDAANAE
ncbi:MAG: zinc ABC transporter substrate-binding protein, partial [Oscillospiraceae bacterium]|nr:zinc ABC transporter substrate-binding protein [Oscillospiraceae bacterium]